jgi:predicted nucleotidyltransferase
MSLLTQAQEAVAWRVLDEEERRRRHLVVSLSGAHAYGFPSPDSDLDLKAIHIEPTTRLLGLSAPAQSASRMEIIDGVEIDYTSNELQQALAGILGGNGNYIERVLGAIPLRVAPELEALRPLVRRSLSRRAHRHYHGFATGQLREFESAPDAPAKKILYVIRTALTGTHLLLTGELVTDVTQLLEQYGFAQARELVEAKRAGERVSLDTARKTDWLKTAARAFDILDDAHSRSILPPEPANRDELEAWLIEQRTREWRRSG